MTLAQLRYFQTACRLGNITAAAKQLHISQPSVSIAIKELEDEFGLDLLDRSSHSFSLTPEGAIFYQQVDGLLSHAEELERSMKDLSQSQRNLRLGIPPMIGTLLLPQLLSDPEPNVELTITESGGKELLTQLDNRQIDMAFLPHNEPLSSKYASVPVTQLETVCCVAVAHPLARRSSISVRDLAEQPLVLMFRDSYFHSEAILRRFQASKLNPYILLQTEQLSTAQNLVAQNKAVGFLFSQIAHSTDGIVGIPLSPPMPVQVSLVWKAGNHLSKPQKAFAASVRVLFNKS